MMQNRTALRTGSAFAGLALIGVLSACSNGAPVDSETDASAAPESSTAPEATTEESASSDSAGEYADGSYTAEGSYVSPGGQETIDVELTLADGVISEVTVTNPDTTNANSLRYQGEFIDGISAEVVGVPIDEVSVDRVGGSSLTSGGFNDALEQIKTDAS
ncbi:FMN-binding protein [Humidisolicoccus flavus]|uniref:FMN-binding protein n=1 Tax=Humidisolicoccus flavus TaxID=3111414 RepID=UPI00324DA34D